MNEDAFHLWQQAAERCRFLWIMDKCLYLWYTISKVGFHAGEILPEFLPPCPLRGGR